MSSDPSRSAPRARRAAGGGPSSSSHFADAVITRVRELGHPLCLGIDPHVAQIPALFRSGAVGAAGALVPGDPATADAVEAFCTAILERAAGRVAIVKPQIAFFEQLGWRGMRALERTVRRAHDAGLLVLLDAKRGDIGSTAEGYARSYLGDAAPTPCDAITVNPYLGLDTLTPFVDAARDHGGGVFVLVKTSNPGSGDLQDLLVEGSPLYERLAAKLAPLADGLLGPETGWSSLGIVAGATWPEQHDLVRKQLPRSLFLVPGYGAQGGSAAEAVRGFVPGPAGLEGGVVSSSRGILFPEAAAAASNAAAWERAVDDALDRAVRELSEAVASDR